MTAPRPPKRVLVRIEPAAERLGLEVAHVRKLVAARRIPFHKAGKYLLFDIDDLDAWVEGSRVEARRERVPA